MLSGQLLDVCPGAATSCPGGPYLQLATAWCTALERLGSLNYALLGEHGVDEMRR